MRSLAFHKTPTRTNLVNNIRKFSLMHIRKSPNNDNVNDYYRILSTLKVNNNTVLDWVE